MEIQVETSFLSVDTRLFRFALQQELRQATLVGLRAYLDKIHTRLPVWTGMLRGAFLNMQQAAGYDPGTIIPNPRSLRQQWYYRPRQINERVVRSINQGRIFSTPANQVVPSNTEVRPGFNVLFNYKVFVDYYDVFNNKRQGFGYNKVGDTKQMPWFAAENAREAFIQKFNEVFKSPRIEQFVLRLDKNQLIPKGG